MNLPPERKGSVARLGAGSARKRGGTERNRRRKLTSSIELLQFVMYLFLTTGNERKWRGMEEREREVDSA